MIRTTRRVVVAGSAVAVAVPALLGAAGPANADPLTGRDFGVHVVEHHESFDGTHNPGVMHQGFSGWHEHMEQRG